MYCTQNAKILLWCDIEHVRILLLLLFHFNIIGVHCYNGVDIFLMGTPLHTGVNLVHFKGAHCDRPEVRSYYFFTFTLSWPEVGKLFLIYFFTFSRPEVGKLFRIYVFTFSTWSWKIIPYFDGLVQDCSNSSELAMELLQSCTKPSKYGIIFQLQVEKK